MKFILPFNHKAASFKISFDDSFLSIGSCFSTHLSSYLKSNKFSVFDNPMGIMYNPLSIIYCLKHALMGTVKEELIIERDGVFYYYHAHSMINARSKAELKKILEEINQTTLSKLKSVNYLVITWGTAYSFVHNSFSETVANCHKMPSMLFSKTIIDAETIVLETQRLLEELHSINPNVKIILSVSPVRHTKLGLSENTIGKAELIKASLALSKTSDKIHYFESYELVTDVLRDYRFFDADMVHPNEQTVDYVLDNFKDVFFNSELKTFITEWEQIKLGLQHRPFNPSSQNHQTFLINLRNRILNLDKSGNFDEELASINRMID